MKQTDTKPINYQLLKVCCQIIKIIFVFAICFSVVYLFSESDADTNEIIEDCQIIIDEKLNSELATENDVFYTKTGKTIHKDPNCRYLKNSTIIYHEDKDKAYSEGRFKKCSYCFAEKDD